MTAIDSSSFYKRWESFLDLGSFTTATFFSLMAREVSIMHPYALGALTASATHALSINASKKVLKADSTALHIAGTIMGLAISTVALPYIMSRCAVHTVLRLNFETALRTALTSLAIKTAAYGLYRMGSEFIDRYRWEVPKELKDLNSLQNSQLTHVKAFFMGHSDQRKGLTLSLQHTLSLPLGSCAGIGDGWTKEMLVAIRNEDLSFLTTEQRQEINQLFMDHDLLPQDREYRKGELPAFPKSIDTLSTEKLSWVHLVLQLSETAIDPKLAQQFFDQGFQPARNEWIEVAETTNIELLEPYELTWLRNYYQAHPEKWKALEFTKQQAFKSKCPISLLLYPKTEQEVKALSKQDLSAYSLAFADNKALKSEFSIEMRRTFADRIEEELTCDVDALFEKGEERVTPNYLFGKVTTQQAIAVGLLVMVVVVPTFIGIGALFSGSPTSNLSKVDRCPDHNCLSIPPGSQVVDHPVASSRSLTLSEIRIIEHAHKGEEASVPKVDRCPDHNCLSIPPGSQVVDHPVPKQKSLKLSEIEVIDRAYKTEEVSLPFLQQQKFSIPGNATNPFIREEGFCKETDRPVQELQSLTLSTPNVTQPVIQEDDLCPTGRCLDFYQPPRPVRGNQFEMPLLQPFAADSWMHSYSANTYAPKVATPQFPVAFQLLAPNDYLVTSAEKSRPFSLIKDRYPEMTFPQQNLSSFPRPTDNWEQGGSSQASYTLLGLSALTSLLAVIGLCSRSKQKALALAERQIVPIEDDRALRVLDPVNDREVALQADVVAINIQDDQEQFQFAFDLSTLEKRRQLFRMFKQHPVRMIEGGHPNISHMQAHVAFFQDGLPQLFQLDLAQPQIAAFFGGLIRQARAGGGLPLQGNSHPRAIMGPQQVDAQIHPPIVRLNHSQIQLNRELGQSLVLMDERVREQALENVGQAKWVAWSHFIGENGHPAKMRKYRVVLEEYLRIVEKQFGISPRDLLLKTRELSAKHSQSTLFQDLHRAVEAMVNPIDPRKEYTDPSSQRYALVQSLRRAIVCQEYQGFHLKPKKKLTEDQDFCRRAVWMLSETLFRPEIYNHLKAITDLFVGESRIAQKQQPDLDPITATSFVRKIHEKNADVKKAPKDQIGKSNAALQYQKLCGALGCEDFIGTKNTPHLRNRYVYRHIDRDETWTVDYFRHGCPVKPGSIWGIGVGMLTRPLVWLTGYDVAARSGEAVAPEYQELLIAKAARREGDLYVNHQRRIPGGVENERDRVEVIEGLQAIHHNEFVLTQSVEGTLFKREAPYADITTFDGLIDAFIETYSQQDNVGKGFYAQNMLPQIFWDNPEYREAYLPKLKEILKLLHTHFFDGREQINFEGFSPTDAEEAYPLREWQVFIELAYSFMRKDLIFRLSELQTKSGRYKITSMKDICKDKLDRGGNEAKNEDETSYYMIGNPKDEWFEETLYQLLGPPILVKKKEAIPRRLKPGLALSQFLRDMSHKKKQLMGSIDFSRWKMHEVQVPKHSDQAAFPTKKTALTRPEYEAYLYTTGESDPLRVAEASKRKFEPPPLAEAQSPEDVEAFLSSQPRRMFPSDVETVLDENVAPYVIKQEPLEIDRGRLFIQINKDLKRHGDGFLQVALGDTVLDGTPGKDADHLFKTLFISMKDANKVLTFMSLLHQGIFAGLETEIRKDLVLDGMETGFGIRGHGKYIQAKKKAIREYQIDVSQPQPTLTASSYYELSASDIEKVEIFREQPYGVLKAAMRLDLNTGRAMGYWDVDTVIPK